MSLYKYLPPLSDRMAIMWTLLNIDDAVVLEFGPAGTTHFSMGLFGRMGIDVLSDRLFTTHMSENDVIMGTVDRLEKAIRELDESRKPKIIFVVASAVSEIIGSDMIGVCSYMQEEVNARLIPTENSGFGDDFSAGLKQIYLTLTKKLATEQLPVQENSYNILGASANSYRIESDLNEIKRLLGEEFGLQCNCVLGHCSTSQEIEALSSAKLNIVLREEARRTAEYLYKKFGTPYIMGAPYGFIGTYEWLEEVGAHFEQKLSAPMLTDLSDRRRMAMTRDRMQMMFGAPDPAPSAALVGEHYVLEGMSNMMAELNVEVTTKICNHTLKTISQDKDDCTRYTKEKDQIQALKELDHHWVLADEISMHCCNASNTKLCVSPPLVHHSQIATHLPFMGIRGAQYFQEQLGIYHSTLN